MSINKVMLTGNATREPEVSQTASGMSVMKLCLAVNDRRKNSAGVWEDCPNFVDCTLFGKRAEALERYISKGTKLAIEGKLRWSSWEKDGEKRSKLEVIVDELELMQKQREEPAADSSEIPF